MLMTGTSDPRRALWPAATCAALTGRTHGCTDQCCKREESPCQLGAVHTWHLADNSVVPAFVRYWSNSGQKSIWAHDGLSAFDPQRTSGPHDNVCRGGPA